MFDVNSKKTLIESFEENVKKYSDDLLCKQEIDGKSYNFIEAETLSGKIYHYLKNKNIGREDMVMVLLSREIDVEICIIGVLKAGAAFVLVDKNTPKDRIEFIKKNANVKETITNDLLSEIYKGEYLAGYEKTNNNDACFAVYTSGITGTPKGILHEYGKIVECVYSTSDNSVKHIKGDLCTHVWDTHPNFMISLIFLFRCLYFGMCLYCITDDTIKNPQKFSQVLIDEKASYTTFPPAYLKYYTNVSPYLKTIAVGGDFGELKPINGIKLFNAYSSSESGIIVTLFFIDKPYEKAPVGKSFIDIKILIIDENGKKLEKNEKGEICFKNNFSRGYINQKELNEKIYKDGILHTGDFGYIDDNGDLVMCGRIDDMFKIDNNRVEPKEIEITAKNIQDAEYIAKCFNNGDSSYIALFYNNKNVNLDLLDKKLKEKLPYYMVPSKYVYIEKIPVTINGKIDRSALAIPDKEVTDFVEPKTELEIKFAEAIKKVLNIEKIGVNDDIFDYGITSLTTMKIMSELKLEKLYITDIYQEKTIAKIIKKYEKNLKNELTEEEKEKIGRTKDYLIDTADTLFIEISNAGRTEFDIVAFKRFTKDMDIKRFMDVFNKYAKNISMFNTIITKNENGNYVHRYKENLFKPIFVENMSENEFLQIKDTLLKPLVMIDMPLYNVRFIETEKYGYCFFQCSHMLIDGQGAKCMYDDLLRIYSGEKNKYMNNYCAVLYDINSEKYQSYYMICKEYYDTNYNNFMNEYTTVIHDENAHKNINSIVSIKDTGIKCDKLDVCLEYYKICRNILFNAVGHLVLEKLSGTSQSLLAYMNCNKLGSNNCAGYLTFGFDTKINVNNHYSINELFTAIQMQINNNLSYISYTADDTEVLIIDDLGDIKKSLSKYDKYIEDVDINSTCEKLAAPVKIQVLSLFNKNDKLYVEFKCDEYYLTKEKQELLIKTFCDYLNRIVNFDESIFDEVKRSVNK